MTVENKTAEGEEIREIEANRRRFWDSEFDDLVRVLADGGSSPSADDMEMACINAGKTLADLAPTVERFQNRRRLYDVYQAGDVDNEFAAINQLIAAENAQLERDKIRYREAIRGFLAQQEALLARKFAADSAKGELRKTASPDLKKRQEGLHLRGLSIESKRRGLNDKVKHSDCLLADLRGQAARGVDVATELAGAERRREQYTADLTRLADDEKQLDADGQRLLREMLVP